MSSKRDLDAFTNAYVEAALWSSMDNADESGGEPLDKNYGPSDLADSTRVAMQRDCASFVERFGRLIEDDDSPEIDKHGRWALAGHKFLLSRNGSGVSFLDGDWPKHGEELDKAAESYGSFELYVGDDKEIYAFGYEDAASGVANEHRDPRTGQFAPGPGPDPAGEWGVVQRMMKVYARAAGLGDYVHNSAVPAGDGTWRFWAQRPSERSKEHRVTMRALKNAYERGGLSERTLAAGRHHHAAPRRPPSRGHGGRTNPGHRVADFNSLEALVEHEQGNGATHVLALGKNTVVYYPTGRYWPTGLPQYEAAKAYENSGYWHVTAQRTPLTGPLHGGAQTIEAFLGRHAEPRGVVRDYDVTDNRGRRLAGPFKDYSQARSEADRQGGVVGFVAGERRGHTAACPVHGVAAPRPQHDYRTEASRRGRPAPSRGRRRPTREVDERNSRTGRFVRPRDYSVLSRHGSKMMARANRVRATDEVDAEAAGERYAEDQVNSDHFMSWVWEQMVEGRRMRRADPKSVIPLDNAADFKRLARNMLQQLMWDTDREMDMHAILAAVGVDSEGTSRDAEVAREFGKGVRGFLLKPSTIQWLASECRRIESELKKGERGKAKAGEPAQTVRLLPPAPARR